MKNNKKVITILTIFTIIFTVMGGSLAYWNWNSNVQTNLAFTIARDFSCSADGGEPMTAEEVQIMPTDCSTKALAEKNKNRFIKRTVKISSNIKREEIDINLSFWLQVNSIAPELSQSEHLRYAFTKSADSCASEVVSTGSLNGANEGTKVSLIYNEPHTESKTDTYYLWIWLDKEESNNNTMNKGFNISLGGECSDGINNQPAKPVLDDGMIPVKIADDGTVTTVSKDDPSWYNYDEKQWANVVLVENSSRNNYKNTSNRVINDSDILAYFVWIPRYKYTIPTSNSVLCSTIVNPTPESHPGCYGAPFTMTEEHQEILLNHKVCTYGWDVDGDGLFDGPNDECYGYFPDSEEIELQSMLNTNSLYIDYSDSGWEYDLENLIYRMGLEEQVTFEKTFYPNNTTYNINIEFEPTTAPRSTGDGVNTYYTHPAFWWDNDNDSVVDSTEMLSGIWVGKFETTSYGEIKEKEYPVSDTNLSDMFDIAKESGNSFGLSSIKNNSHVSKNSEWGAVTYLSHSKYGINNNIMRNNSWSFTDGETGNVSNTSYGYSPSNFDIGAGYTYGYMHTYPQSTTGNISGVFDMSGGRWEYTMANYNGLLGESGFTELPEKKYYDSYGTTNALTACNGGICYGHAISETKGWYGAHTGMIYTDKPWQIRGGQGTNTNASQFGYATETGGARQYASFRTVIINGFPN